MKEQRITVGVVKDSVPDLEIETLKGVEGIEGFREGVDFVNTELNRQEQDLADEIRKILGRKVKLLVGKEPAYVIMKVPSMDWFEEPSSLKQTLRELRERSSPELVGEVFIKPNQYLIRDDGVTYFELYRDEEMTEGSIVRYRLTNSDLVDLGPLLEQGLNNALNGKQELEALVWA